MCMHLLENVHHGAYFGNWYAWYKNAFLQKIIKIDAENFKISSFYASMPLIS